MIETSTKNQEYLPDGKRQGDITMETMNQTELDFYSSIFPSLNNLIKTPSDEVIDKILAYSKTF